MELSPEERKRIYLEEKARLEEREQLKKPHTTKKRSRFKWVFLVLFAFVFVMAMLETGQKRAPVPKSEEEVQAEKARYANCEQKLKKAQELDMLYEIKAKGASIRVLVGPTFFSVPIDAKQGFAEVVNCVLLSGGSGGIPFDFVHWQTGKRVATWNGYRIDMD